MPEPESWRGPVNEVLYPLILSRADHARAEQLAALIRGGKVLTGGAGRFRDAIRDALAQPRPVGDGMPTDHGEAQVRAFLQDLLALLDEPG